MLETKLLSLLKKSFSKNSLLEKKALRRFGCYFEENVFHINYENIFLTYMQKFVLLQHKK